MEPFVASVKDDAALEALRFKSSPKWLKPGSMIVAMTCGPDLMLFRACGDWATGGPTVNGLRLATGTFGGRRRGFSLATEQGVTASDQSAKIPERARLSCLT
jgi:hypothetical protein